MSLFTPLERTVVEAVSRIVYCNPFLPERIQGEREALGAGFVEPGADWNARRGDDFPENVDRLAQTASDLAEACRGRLSEGKKGNPAELTLYEDLVLFALYHQHYRHFTDYIEKAMGHMGEDESKQTAPKVAFYRSFAASAAHLLKIPGVDLPGREQEPAWHLFACFFQIRRAFHHIFGNIVGSSPAACRLRAAAWESIFTHDLRRYRRTLFSRMGDITTLITGPSGTGKELVARAIGLSRYIPFEPGSQTFTEDFTGSFHPLSISALSPTLVESELFGHRRGSFTGALDDRAGWLEVCRPQGTVFLDEVGEIDPPIQVKLLRVLQTRTFQRLGDTKTRRFVGKIIAATNRDLAKEMRAGRFREDFYYRLCSDMVTTPSLHELLAGSEDELRGLVQFIAARVAPGDAEKLTEQVQQWIRRHLGPDYPWPGNFRELEQCVRNVLVRGEYRPVVQAGADSDGADQLVQSIREGAMTADDLVRRYCTLVYRRTGSYEETARRLKLDRRTVKGKVER